jgi:hypothetical protein
LFRGPVALILSTGATRHDDRYVSQRANSDYLSVIVVAVVARVQSHTKPSQELSRKPEQDFHGTMVIRSTTAAASRAHVSKSV